MAADVSKVKFKILGTNEPVPEGYVCLGERWPAKGVVGRDRERLRAAMRDGQLGDAYRRVRFSGDDQGPIYVSESAAVSYLRRYESENEPRPAAKQSRNATPAFSAPQIEAAVIAMCEINNGITLMQATLERLTTAVESIATQPKTPQHELLHTFNGNGFHS
jgi:hypothetical protein